MQIRPLRQSPPKLISVNFFLGLQLSKFLSFKEEVRVLKTSLAPLKGNLKYTIHQDDICLSIETNQPIYICGNKKAEGTHSFSAIETDGSDESTVKNYSNDFSRIATKLLSGFSNTAEFRSFLMPAGSRLFTYVCASKGAIRAINSNGIDFNNIANRVGTITPSEESLKRFRSAVKSALDHSLDSPRNGRGLDHLNKSKICNCIGECFSHKTNDSDIALKLTHRHELCKDLVFWAYDNIDQPVSLEKAITALHTTSASLSQGCKEILGIGPMEIIRHIRLEHIHFILSNRDVRLNYGFTSVEGVRENFGFKTRGNFSALYKKYFDETPKETLLKSNNSPQKYLSSHH